ncbi:hypothetical protein HDC90_001552 [Pedobacter sp. AK013]|nr:hypothetical protein [Pedobacter sp. AK013]
MKNPKKNKSGGQFIGFLNLLLKISQRGISIFFMAGYLGVVQNSSGLLVL